METANYIAQLNEFSQRTRSELHYEDVGSVGPDHIKMFTMRVVVNGKAYPEGMGKNKKEAKQNAARNALLSLLQERTETTENPPETPNTPIQPKPISSINYICWLNEYGQRQRVAIRPLESTKLGPDNNTQCCSFVVGDKEYPAAYGKTKREAKEEAARLVYQEVCCSKTTEGGVETPTHAKSPQKEELKQNVSDIIETTKKLNIQSAGNSLAETNFIQMINHHCQKTKRSHDYILERKCGPPHSPQFFYKLVIDKKEYPVAEGKNVKEAKQNAAQLAWNALQRQPDWDSKATPWSASSDDGSPARFSTPPCTPVPRETQMNILSTPTNLSPLKNQSPDVKPRIRLAANFQSPLQNSKEAIVNFKEKIPDNGPSEKQSNQAPSSRFTSEYDNIECLGKGAFGRVFKARERLVDKFYAIKIVRCKDRKALREVGALSDLQHPNIIRYYKCWMEETGYKWDSTSESSSSSQSTSNASIKFLYIQIELCDTRTLRVWIDEKNTQNVKKSLRNSKRREKSLQIAQQIVRGVDYIHVHKLIHRDLKPANIMFGRDKKVKIGDFGLVTDENDDDAENLLERTVYKGTPSYMAPEQKNRSTYDRKVDVFAIGLIYFELLWNLCPERKAVWEDVRNQRFPDGFSTNFPQEKRVINSMLHLKPENRPEASQLKAELDQFVCALTDPKNRESRSV